MYLRPDPTSPWYYINSAIHGSDENPLLANVRPEFPFSERVLRVDDDVFEVLRNPANSVLLGVATAVEEGTEMLLNYPFPGGAVGDTGRLHRSAD